MHHRRSACLLLVCLLTASLFLPSCKSGDADEDAPPRPVFTEKRVPLPSDYTGKLQSGALSYLDGRIRADVWRVFTSDEVGEYVEDRTVSWNADGEDFREEDGGRSFAPCVPDADVQRAVAFEDGSIATFELSTELAGVAGWFCVRSEAGDCLVRIDLPGALGYDMSREEERYISGEGFSMNAAAAAETADGIRYVAATGSGIACFTEKGETCWTVRNVNATAAFVSGGRLYCFIRTQSGQKLFPFDLTSGERGEEIVLPEELTDDGAGEEAFFAGDSALHAVFFQNKKGLWSLEFTMDDSGKDVCRYELLIDWNASDLYGNYRSIYVRDRDTVYALNDESHSLDDDWYLHVLKRVPDDVLVNRVEMELVYLGSGWDSDLRAAVVTFNRAHPECHITVTDYYADFDDSGENGRVRLDAALAAGYAPDLICIDPVSNRDTTGDDYCAAHVFADLNALLDNVSGFDRRELLGYLTRPYTNADGTQYLLPFDRYNTFGTVFADGTVFDGVPTVEEMMAYIDASPEQFRNVNVRWYLSYGGMNDLIDLEAGVCSFDDGRFAERLRFLSAYNERLTEEKKQAANVSYSAGDLIQMFRRGDAALYSSGNFSSLYSYVKMKKQLGDAVRAVGYPNEERLLYASENICPLIGVTEVSGHRELAAEFVASLFAPEEIELHTYESNRQEYKLYSMEICPNRTRADIYAQAACFEGKTIVVDGDDARSARCLLVDDAAADDYAGEKFRITREDAEEFIAFLDSVDRIASTSGPVWDMIREEAFLSNAPRTPEQIGEILQSRVSIYLSEKKQ